MAGRSSRATQLTYWRPPPITPPSPARNSGSIRPSAPPFGERTIPIRNATTRIPFRAAGAEAASHSRQTSARNPAPGGLSSVNGSSPRSP